MKTATRPPTATPTGVTPARPEAGDPRESPVLSPRPGAAPSDYRFDGVLTPPSVCRVIFEPVVRQLRDDVRHGRTVDPEILTWLEAIHHTARSTSRTALSRREPSISADLLTARHDALMRLLHPLTEVAPLLGVSLSTVERLVRAGDLPAVRLGRRTCVARKDLDAFVDRLRAAA